MADTKKEALVDEVLRQQAALQEIIAKVNNIKRGNKQLRESNLVLEEYVRNLMKSKEEGSRQENTSLFGL